MAEKACVRSRVAPWGGARFLRFAVCAIALVSSALGAGCPVRAPGTATPAAPAPASDGSHRGASTARGKTGDSDGKKREATATTIVSPANPEASRNGAVGNPPASAPAIPSQAPSATGEPSRRDPSAVSSYVFSPSSVVSAAPSELAGSTATSDSTAAASRGAAGPSGVAAEGAEAPSGGEVKSSPVPDRKGEESNGTGELRLWTVASAAVIPVGGTVTVDVMADSGVAVVDAPLHLAYDPSVLAFLDGSPGDFLTRGGSDVVFLVDGKSRPGDVSVAVGRVDRASGALGLGLLCRLRFAARGVGDTVLRVNGALAWDAAGQAVRVATFGGSIAVR